MGVAEAAVVSEPRPSISIAASPPTTTTAAAAAGITHLGVAVAGGATPAAARDPVADFLSCLSSSAWNERISVGDANRVSSSGAPSPAAPSARRIHCSSLLSSPAVA